MEGEKDYRRDLGQRGEDLACAELVRMGHLILERNCRIGHLEVDIISYDTAGIHFVEVKTRRMSIQAPPQENVDASKQRKLVKGPSAERATTSVPKSCAMSAAGIPSM